MNNTPGRTDSFPPSVFRYGMLGPILALAVYEVLDFVRAPDGERLGKSVGVVLVSMLVVNHFVMSFLSPERQRAVQVPHLLFIAVAFVYGVVTIVLEWP